MAMGLVDDIAFQEELLKKHNNKIQTPTQHGEIKELPPQGRSKGATEVPESLRKIVGEDAIENGNKSALAFAEALGISPSSVSAYKNGATSTSTYNEPNVELSKHINKTRERLVKKASTKLELTLEELTSEKLSGVSATSLSQIARNMASIVKDLEPEEEKVNKNQMNNQFIIMAPQVSSLDNFLKDEDVIDMRNE